MVLIFSLIAVLIVSLLSLVGVIVLILSDKILKKILIFLVAFSAGSLMGGAFFHILPESMALTNESLTVFVYLMIGFCLFFVLERILRWHHCHQVGCETHTHLGWINLFGDGVHNFLDGMIILIAFSVNIEVGVAVTISIIFHEIPQEIGDFGVLIYSGFSKFRALAYNFISALTSFLGVFLAYFLVSSNVSLEAWLLPLAAGGFIYIGASDLIPEIHKQHKFSSSIWSFLVFLLALVFMYIIKIIFD